MDALRRLPDRELDLASEGGSFHVVHGHNEAGKTTALRAITALFHGFLERTPDAFSRRGAARAGCSRWPSGERLEVVRRKVARHAARCRGAGPAGCGARALPGRRRPRGLSRCSASTTPGSSRAAAICSRAAAIGSALFGAAAGLRGVEAARRRAAAEAAAIWKPNGTNPALNQALRDHRAARARVREASLKPTAWQGASA
ncbi:MAG: AAA family ATPase [Myxococcota bacterium]